MMSELLVVGDLGLLALSSGYWLGLDRGEKGDFTSAEKLLSELFAAENRVVESLTVKVFDWFELPVEEAIASTLDPYYPGLTGDIEAVKRLLEGDEEARKALGSPIPEAPEDAVGRIAEMLYEHLKRASRSSRRVTEVVGIARYTMRLPVKDLRRLPAAIASWLDTRGVLATMPLGSTLDTILRLADAAYASSFEATVKTLDRLYKSSALIEVREYGPVRLCIARGVEEDAIYPIVAKQLRLLGLCPPDTIPAVDTGSAIHALLDTAAWEPRHERLREAMRRGCLRYIEDSVYAEARPC
jgi:single-stranded-DNA-specific exonuclease